MIFSAKQFTRIRVERPDTHGIFSPAAQILFTSGAVTRSKIQSRSTSQLVPHRYKVPKIVETLFLMLTRTFASLLTLLLTTQCFGEVHVFHHENILGTSMELRIDSDSKAIANDAESAVLAEIERTAAIFSTYDANSEYRKWYDGDGAETSISPELTELLLMCESLWSTTDGAFDPRVGIAIAAWKQAEKENKIPADSDLKKLATQIQEPTWSLNGPKRTLKRTKASPMTFDGIAKGKIVDLALQKAVSMKGVSGVMLNVGGDLRVSGSIEQEIEIANPASPETALKKISIKNKAVATSGNYHRGFKIDGKLHSHIIDPRTAKPVEHVKSASVIAENAALADALATAFSVLSPERSISICNSDPKIACFLVANDGKQYSSVGWPSDKASSTDPSHSTDASAPTITPGDWIAGAELRINFELNNADGRRYRRPYVAIWVEDKEQQPIRTITLWLQKDNPGPRWHRDLKRWYKQNGSRKLESGSNLIATVSAATKPAGAYTAIWDGKDDNGKPVPKGKYTLLLEVAREHGTYQLMSTEVVIGDSDSGGDLGKNAEIKSMTFQYKTEGKSK